MTDLIWDFENNDLKLGDNSLVIFTEDSSKQNATSIIYSRLPNVITPSIGIPANIANGIQDISLLRIDFQKCMALDGARDSSLKKENGKIIVDATY